MGPHVGRESAWAGPSPPGLCTARCARKADASPRMSKAGLELGDTVEGHWEWRPGRVLVRAPLRSLLCFPRPSGQGPLHTSALMGASPGWGQEPKRKVSLLRVQRGWSRGDRLTWPLPTDWEAKAGEGTDGGGQRLESSPWTARFDSALTKPRQKGKEGEAGPWDGCGWARWGDGVGLWPGWAVGLRARPGLGGGSRARAGGLLIQPNNDETAPLSCGAKVAVTGGGVT